MTPGHAFYSPLAADVGGGLNWTFFAAGHVLAGFEPSTATETVLSLWRTANAPDASIESVVAAVPTRGPSAVESFAVVVVGERTTLVLRGSASVDVQTVTGQRRIDSRNMQPWYLAEFDGVTGLTLGSSARPAGVDSAPGSADLPLASGVIRAPWLAWTSAEAGAAPPVESPRRSRRAERRAPLSNTIVPHQPSAPISGQVPVQNLAVAPGPYRAPITMPIPVIPVGGLPPMPSSRPAAAPPENLDDTVRGLGTGRWTSREGERAAEVAQAAEASGADIEDTIVTRRRHRADVPPLATWSPARMEFDPRFAPGGDTRGGVGWYCFRIAGGQVYQLDTPVYIGRKPSSPRIVTGTLPRLLKVASPTMEVSSTHLEVRQEGGSVVVTDMRSTNGTFVSQPGAAPVKLRQGESMVVTPGTLVDIGDGNVVEILPIR
ncbi:MAG TPA: FHA domain-containing protein [Naasia sp.]